ncbi:alkaline phosphatase D [Caulobacter ginsengisoli]|uniref:Alkaline phosphatase D n=1 Tax=Caulobacter ginsengisoli TaxID=400775 RepID=A0ABU0IWF7_9CAUL|nr:alkaline phosphatase D family protein [Caulobacter ginsengisoli]MDQ0466345.1 alkaline phosphatase D [Caulobacter ginsengisoli]
MTLNRRQAFALAGAAAVAGTGQAQAQGPAVFAHGVASGDPLTDRVILWTRVAGDRALTWQIAEDAAFAKVAKQGVATSDAARDGCVKIDVPGLKPGRDYWYRFECGGTISPTGRSRTLPKGKTDEAVLAVATCALYPGGYYTAYRAIADLARVDAVVHLGDYIYEYGDDGFGGEIGTKLGRVVQPTHECLTLADYRVRHAQAKSDPDLQAAHARAPFIVVWDDHEVCNDTWHGGGENHQPETEGAFADRKAAALRAYYEWMPIREPSSGDLVTGIERSFRFGDLAELIMVETRLGARDIPPDYGTDLMVAGKPDRAAFVAKWNDPARQMLGPRQEAWLGRQLKDSVKAGVTWQLLGNQVVMAHVKMPDLQAAMTPAAWKAMLDRLPKDIAPQVAQATPIARLKLPYNLDAWDGYPAARQRVYDLFKASKARPIVLAGDSHAHWANDLLDGVTGERVGAEFGATGITSPGFTDVLGADVPVNQSFVEQNDGVVYTDHGAKGFVVLTLTHSQARAEMMGVSTILKPEAEAAVLKTFTVAPGEKGGVGPVTLA